jgi:hypothetical protein
MKKISAESFNRRFPIGTPVRYWAVLPQHPSVPPKDTKTRSAAWEVANGRPIVMIEGLSGGVALSHIEILEKV